LSYREGGGEGAVRHDRGRTAVLELWLPLHKVMGGTRVKIRLNTKSKAFKYGLKRGLGPRIRTRTNDEWGSSVRGKKEDSAKGKNRNFGVGLWVGNRVQNPP